MPFSPTFITSLSLCIGSYTFMNTFQVYSSFIKIIIKFKTSPHILRQNFHSSIYPSIHLKKIHSQSTISRVSLSLFLSKQSYCQLSLKPKSKETFPPSISWFMKSHHTARSLEFLARPRLSQGISSPKSIVLVGSKFKNKSRLKESGGEKPKNFNQTLVKPIFKDKKKLFKEILVFIGQFRFNLIGRIFPGLL